MSEPEDFESLRARMLDFYRLWERASRAANIEAGKVRDLTAERDRLAEENRALKERVAQLDGDLHSARMAAQSRVEGVTDRANAKIFALEAENARLRHAERRFTEERAAGLRREVEAARERVAGLEGDLASAERWLSGGTPEPLDSVEREIAAAEPIWNTAAGRRLIEMAYLYAWGAASEDRAAFRAIFAGSLPPFTWNGHAFFWPHPVTPG